VLSGTLDGAMFWELLKPTTAKTSETEAKVRMMNEYAGRDAWLALALRDG